MGLSPGLPRRLPHGGFGLIRHADGAAEVVGVHVVEAGAFGHCVEGRRTWFETIGEMQKVLGDYLVTYNTKRPHQGRGMNGRTPLIVSKAGLAKTTPQMPKEKREKSPPQKTENQLAA